MWIWFALGAAALVLLWAVLTYNSLVRHRNWVAEAWSGIDVQLRRRHDLVPNLVEVAEAFRLHERSVMERVTAARVDSQRVAGPRATDAQSTSARAVGAAESRLGRAIADLVAVVENYPDLKSSEVYLKLQADLVDIEDHLQFARRYYNGTVRNLNNRVQIFPSSLVARGFGFRPAEFFEIDDDAKRSVPKVPAS